jgi:hypothetical protein
MYQMIASLASGYLGQKFGGGDDKASKSQSKQSEIERKSMERLYAMSKDGSLDPNAPTFKIGNAGWNRDEIMGGTNFALAREMGLLKELAGLVEGTAGFGMGQDQVNAASEAALAEQLAPLIQELMKGAGTKQSPGIAGSLGEVSHGSQAAWNEPY